ncbi:MAG: hypothetical protein ACRDH2_16675 [Anaerolineales bacterium]
MNVQWPAGLSDVRGETGHLIMRASVAGEGDPLKSAHRRLPGCQSRADESAQALTGTGPAEPRFERPPALERVDFDTRPRTPGDAELERRLAAVKPRGDVPADWPPWPQAQRDSRRNNQPPDNARAER